MVFTPGITILGPKKAEEESGALRPLFLRANLALDTYALNGRRAASFDS
jgi:hypothetical protein